jgi:hypothetical protein
MFIDYVLLRLSRARGCPSFVARRCGNGPRLSRFPTQGRTHLRLRFSSQSGTAFSRVVVGIQLLRRLPACCVVATRFDSLSRKVNACDALASPPTNQVSHREPKACLVAAKLYQTGTSDVDTCALKKAQGTPGRSGCSGENGVKWVATGRSLRQMLIPDRLPAPSGKMNRSPCYSRCDDANVPSLRRSRPRECRKVFRDQV